MLSLPSINQLFPDLPPLKARPAPFSPYASPPLHHLPDYRHPLTRSPPQYVQAIPRTHGPVTPGAYGPPPPLSPPSSAASMASTFDLPPTPHSQTILLSSPPLPQIDVEDDGSTDDGDDPDRRHVCSECSKRFNRPSSLRTHLHTHTGFKPFRCPFPSCGRLFNVNSNMRRHYRTHGPHNPRTRSGSTASRRATNPEQAATPSPRPAPSPYPSQAPRYRPVAPDDSGSDTSSVPGTPPQVAHTPHPAYALN
jgi:uncharacterized Zn-finger protein